MADHDRLGETQCWIDRFIEADSLNGGDPLFFAVSSPPEPSGKSNWVVIRIIFEACRIGFTTPLHCASDAR